MTGAPEFAGAMESVEHGAFRYLVKLIAIAELRETTSRSCPSRYCFARPAQAFPEPTW